MASLFERPLKDAGNKALEDAITKAVCELAGEDYEVDIQKLDFGDTVLSQQGDVVNITLTISKVFKGFGEPIISNEDTVSPA